MKGLVVFADLLLNDESEFIVQTVIVEDRNPNLIREFNDGSIKSVVFYDREILEIDGKITLGPAKNFSETIVIGKRIGINSVMLNNGVIDESLDFSNITIDEAIENHKMKRVKWKIKN